MYVCVYVHTNVTYTQTRVVCVCTHSCVTLCDPTDCSPPGFSVHGISQARILKWVAIPFFRVSSWPRDWTLVSCTEGRFSTIWATREANWGWWRCPRRQKGNPWLHLLKLRVSHASMAPFNLTTLFAFSLVPLVSAAFHTGVPPRALSPAQISGLPDLPPGHPNMDSP